MLRETKILDAFDFISFAADSHLTFSLPSSTSDERNLVLNIDPITPTEQKKNLRKSTEDYDHNQNLFKTPDSFFQELQVPVKEKALPKTFFFEAGSLLLFLTWRSRNIDFFKPYNDNNTSIYLYITLAT